MEHVNRYFRAWNAHDPDAIMACFSRSGTFEDPPREDPSQVPPSARRRMTCCRIPEFRSPRSASNSVQARRPPVPHAGDQHGRYSAGAAVRPGGTLPGSDFFTWDPRSELLTSVRGYWDLAGFLATMGLQVHPSPAGIPGLVDFGSESEPQRVIPGHLGASPSRRLMSGQSAWEVNDVTEKITTELMAQEGYLGSVFATAGGRQ